MLLIYSGMRRVHGPVYSQPLIRQLEKYIWVVLEEATVRAFPPLYDLATSVMGGRRKAPVFTQILVLMAAGLTVIPKLARWTLALIELYMELENGFAATVSGLLARSLEAVSELEQLYWIALYTRDHDNLYFLQPILQDLIRKGLHVQDALFSKDAIPSELKTLMRSAVPRERRLKEARAKFFEPPSPPSGRLLRIGRVSDCSMDMYQAALQFYGDMGDALVLEQETGGYEVALMTSNRMERLGLVLAMMRLFQIAPVFPLTLGHLQEMAILGFADCSESTFKRIEVRASARYADREDCHVIEHQEAFQRDGPKRHIVFRHDLDRRIEKANSGARTIIGPWLSWPDLAQ